MSDRPQTLLDGLRFPEGPRWHQDKFWFSDMHSKCVIRVGLDGQSETVVEVPNEPSGLGWTPDGKLLIASMGDRRLLRLEGNALVEVADLSSTAPFHINDMVVDSRGRAYVGNFGFDLLGGEEPKPTNLALAYPDGEVKIVAEDMHFPNGAVITPDGRTLIIGESFGSRLTAFDIQDDGTLRNRRVWADLGDMVPDGCCLDTEGAIWVACPTASTAIRVREGGNITHRIPVETDIFACMLGGPDRRTLFLCTASDSDPEKTLARDGRIQTLQVEVPGAGLP